MKKRAFLFALVLVMAALSIASTSCAEPAPLTLEEKAQEIYSQLMCPLCDGQTIDQSSSELSAQMRALIREKLAQGESREEILQFFVERYGEKVLAAPIKSGFNLIVWFSPALAIVIGGFILWVIIRRRVRSGAALSVEPRIPDEDEIQYRERLERELRSFNESGFR